MTWQTTYLGLGTNLGDRLAQLRQALDLLHATRGIRIGNVSSVYETAPVGYLDQPDFFNLVCEVQTTLSPLQLLHSAQAVEQALHRERIVRWGPRTMDIDLLLYSSEIVQQPELLIPHPRMHERAFVLVPLAELAPQLRLPGIEQTLAALLEKLPDEQSIKRASEQLVDVFQ
jgi:2-amino-4-hydroxy-6-hydroxymethyldihydropteridine diphosphokinase